MNKRPDIPKLDDPAYYPIIDSVLNGNRRAEYAMAMCTDHANLLIRHGDDEARIRSELHKVLVYLNAVDENTEERNDERIEREHREP